MGRKRTILRILGTGLVLLSLSCSSIFAPNEGELTGMVVDDCGRALGGASVMSWPGGAAVSSDASGRFVLKDLPAGGYTLTAARAAYAGSSVKADLEETGGLSCATPEGSAPTIVLSLEGWQYFAGDDFDQAILEFDDAIAEDPDCKDAHNGRGWTYARMDSLSDAAAAFEAALAIDGTFLDAHTGLALVSSAANDHDQAIASAMAVLDEEGDEYVFRRDDNIVSAVLRLVLAQSYFYTAQYTSAQEQVDLLDPDNGLDPADSDTWRVDGTDYSTYEEALLMTIHLLGL